MREFLQKIKANSLNVHNSSLNSFQLMFVMIALWWGIGGMLEIDFIISYLNYLCNFPGNIIVTTVGLIGLIGMLLQNSKMNFIFALCNIFLFSSVAFAFWSHHSISMSAGTYGILLLGSILLLIRLQSKKEKDQRFQEYLNQQK